MTITYYGHSAVKLKGKLGSVVMDPFDSTVGLSLPALSSDIVTVSHDHADHNAVGMVSSTSKRKRPFVINTAGEYEVGGISVFGTRLFHDQNKGEERGTSIAFTVLLDQLRVCHLGDLGHELSAEDIDNIGNVDILFCPVGGVTTIDPMQAIKVIRSLEPSIVIPIHYSTQQQTTGIFATLAPVTEFTKEYGRDVVPVKKFDIDRSGLPEETELVVLEPAVSDRG
jgi:L-ascorbate metabolism protein UlaG (beta-lactamase superfamily)